jgi:hypothetical protein
VHVYARHFTFVQRFCSPINLIPHLHALVLDGVYIRDDDGVPFFVPAPPLTDGDSPTPMSYPNQILCRTVPSRGHLR